MKYLLLLTLLGTCGLISVGCGSEGLTLSSSSLDLPAAIEGTTVKAKVRDTDPACGESGPTVWYRFDPEETSRIAVRFHAGGDLEATICALEEGVSGLSEVDKRATDDVGNARFDFDVDAGTSYYLAVGQNPESEPGEYALKVEQLPRPQNDERANATEIASLPSDHTGTTVGATHDDGDPECIEGGPSVWYRLSSSQTGPVVVRLQAANGGDASICAMQKIRSHVEVLGRDGSGARGDASLRFTSKAGATYFIAVSRTLRSGSFSLNVREPDAPHLPPGADLEGSMGRGQLDPLANPEDAWAVTMDRGRTYRLALVTRPDECVTLTVFTTRTRSFKTGKVAAQFECAGTEFFAPGPDGGGTYPVLLTVGGDETSYELFVNPVEPDDSGPGVPLETGTGVVGFVSAADPLDLYRFDVPGTSRVEIQLASKRYVDVELKNSYGRTIGRPDPNTTSQRVLDPGTYYLAVMPGDQASRYTLRLIVRFLTTTSLTVDGASSVTIGPGEAVSIQTTTTPYPGAGVTEIQADFFDVATGTWVFRQLWEVEPGSVFSFTPDAVGRWRVRATFQANDVASSSRTEYCTITVSTV